MRKPIWILGACLFSVMVLVGLVLVERKTGLIHQKGGVVKLGAYDSPLPTMSSRVVGMQDVVIFTPSSTSRPAPHKMAPLKSAVDLSPKGEILDPGVAKDYESLLSAANKDDTAAQLSIYRWWGYCQQYMDSLTERSGVCSGIKSDSSLRRSMLIRTAEARDWRSVDHLFSEYVSANSYEKPSSQLVDFNTTALKLLNNAANAGVAEAVRSIAMIYYNGVGVQRDPVIAYAFMDRYMTGRKDDAAGQAMLDTLRPLLRQGDWVHIAELQKGY